MPCKQRSLCKYSWFGPLSEYLTSIWGCSMIQFDVTLNINNHNSVGWNIRGFSTLCWHQWIHCINRMSKHTLTKIHSSTMSNVSFTIHVHTPTYLTSHRPHSWHLLYYHIGLQYLSNPQNIIQKFPAQFFGTDTSTAIDQCGILFIPTRPVHYFSISISPS